MENNLPIYLFKQGTNFNAYEYFGAHFFQKNNDIGVIFRVFAGRAKSVSVIGSFNMWNKNATIMNNIDSGIFEVFVKDLKEYDTYKFCITTIDGRELIKTDPFAFHTETPPNTASKIYNLDGFDWNDKKYFENLNSKVLFSQPINIYEVNFCSWKKYPDGSFYNYKKLAKDLVNYLIKMNYTHVEIMPITEFPFDGSWGYQVTGFFAITSRFGVPKDFMYFVNECHKNNIGVIIDWVPAHFPKDEHGLYEFDGSPLFENAGWDRIEHKGWGTRRFDYGRTEVQSFLVSSAVFLFEKFHIDGIRVDAVASMLYLDYDKKPGEWLPNQYGDNKNIEAIEFIKKLNTEIFKRFPYALMIAEESTSFSKVTKPVEDGGLGFNFKWNMGWMNDALCYMSIDPYFRGSNHAKLTFPLVYAFSENFILPISHDEVVHGKKSLLDKMPGSYEDKFSNLRAFYGYMYSQPGKKLNFMGNEFGQFKEWNYEEGLEYFLLEYEKHKKLHLMVKELNLIYKTNKELFEVDDSWSGFSWIILEDKDKSILSYKRIAKDKSFVIVVINFSGIDLKNYKIEIENGKYNILFNSDNIRYGGKGFNTKRIYKSFKENNKDYICINLPKLSCIYLSKTLIFKGEEKC